MEVRDKTIDGEKYIHANDLLLKLEKVYLCLAEKVGDEFVQGPGIGLRGSMAIVSNILDQEEG